jgi:hypothetical protein
MGQCILSAPDLSSGKTMDRHRTHQHYELPLPWQIELGLWLVGLLCIPFGMWWITNEITSPATMFGEMLGVTVNIQNLVEPFRPVILLFGLLIGWRVRCWLRRALVEPLDRIV